MMHLFEIEKIKLPPLLVSAEDFDHAAEIFRHTLARGLTHVPNDVDFNVTQWRIKRKHQDKPPWSWIKQGKAGVFYPVEEGWEFVTTNMVRGMVR
jgi:hypothetical protein